MSSDDIVTADPSILMVLPVTEWNAACRASLSNASRSLKRKSLFRIEALP